MRRLRVRVPSPAPRLWCGLVVVLAVYGLGVWGRFPSGQRDQTVNLTAQPSEVRILLSPFALPMHPPCASLWARRARVERDHGLDARDDVQVGDSDWRCSWACRLTMQLRRAACRRAGRQQTTAETSAGCVESMGPGSSVVERFLGKEEVGSSILLSGFSLLAGVVMKAKEELSGLSSRPVAPSGRAPVSKTGCWGFESLLACLRERGELRLPDVAFGLESLPWGSR